MISRAIWVTIEMTLDEENKNNNNIKGDKFHAWMRHLTSNRVFRQGVQCQDFFIFIFMKDEIKMYCDRAITDAPLCAGLLT